MRKLLHHLPAALCLLGLTGEPLLAAAQTGGADNGDRAITGSDIQRYQDEISVLEQQLKIAQLKKQIRDADAKEAGPANAMRSPAAPVPAPVPATVQAPASDTETAPPAPPPLPQVVSIAGVGNRLTATLRLADGGEVIARPAMGLPGGLIVHDISADGVRVIQNGDLVTLPFGDGPPPSTTSTQPQLIQLPPISHAPVMHAPPIPVVPSR